MFAGVAGSGGCCSASRDPEVRRLMDTLPVASAIGQARHLAYWMQEDLKSNTPVSDADKAELRARAQILDAQAGRLEKGMEQYGRADPGVSKRNLMIRTEALEREHLAVMREWMVWQVRHGLRQPSDVRENVDVGRLLETE